MCVGFYLFVICGFWCNNRLMLLSKVNTQPYPPSNGNGIQNGGRFSEQTFYVLKEHYLCFYS